MQRKFFNIATAGLLSIGIASAIIILYDYIESPHLIPREQAVSAAVKFIGLNDTTAANATIQATLDQIKENGKAIILDQGTLKPTCCADFAPFGYPDEYMWRITVTTKSDKIHGVTWHYNLDAATGKMVETDHENTIFPG